MATRSARTRQYGNRASALEASVPKDQVEALVQERVANETAHAAIQIEMLQESLTDMLIKADDAGWAAMNTYGTEKEQGLTLDELQRMVKTTRPLVNANPQIRKGVNARIHYVWGDGVQFESPAKQSKNKLERILELNKAFIFSAPAYEQLERALATDGNVFFLMNKKTNKIIRVPLSQVTDMLSSPYAEEETWYIERTQTQIILGENGQKKTVTTKALYPTISRINTTEEGALPTKIDRVDVDPDWVARVVSVNQQIGWTLGTPDVLSSMYWARAYKEFLESSWSIVRALSKFVWKVTQPNAKAANKSAAKLAQPTVGPQDAALGGGADITALNRAGATPDFTAAEPIAAMVSMGLDLPVKTLLGQEEPEEIPFTVLRAMSARQLVWDLAFTEILTYMGVRDVSVVFRPIQSQALHRVLQAIVVGANTGTLHPSEVRQLVVLVLQAIGLTPKTALPKAGQWAEFVKGVTDNAGHNENDNPGTKTLDTPDPTGTGGPGTLSDGKDHHELDNSAAK